jgi:beta-glucosidase
MHHLNLAHGLAVQAVRAAVGDTANTSITHNLTMPYPASDAAADAEAAEEVWRIDNGVFLRPELEGVYDPQLVAATAHVSDWSFVRDGDLDTIRQPISVLGLNYYQPVWVRRARGVKPAGDGRPAWTGPRPGVEAVEFLPPTGALTAMGWGQHPEGLTDLLARVAGEYPGLPLVVTENGSAWDDSVSEDGLVHDPERVAYLADHIEAIGAALDRGVPLTGYFAWSLLDNFEWARGYTKRFGLFRCDYRTQARIWKDSARWFQQLATTNAVPAEGWLR